MSLPKGEVGGDSYTYTAVLEEKKTSLRASPINYNFFKFQNTPPIPDGFHSEVRGSRKTVRFCSSVFDFFFLQLVNLCSGRLTRPDSSPHIRTSVKQICVWFINTNLHNTLAISWGMLVHMADRWPTVVCYQPFAKTRNRAAPL